MTESSNALPKYIYIALQKFAADNAAAAKLCTPFFAAFNKKFDEFREDAIKKKDLHGLVITHLARLKSADNSIWDMTENLLKQYIDNYYTDLNNRSLIPDNQTLIDFTASDDEIKLVFGELEYACQCTIAHMVSVRSILCSDCDTVYQAASHRVHNIIMYVLFVSTFNVAGRENNRNLARIFLNFAEIFAREQGLSLMHVARTTRQKFPVAVQPEQLEERGYPIETSLPAKQFLKRVSETATAFSFNSFTGDLLLLLKHVSEQVDRNAFVATVRVTVISFHKLSEEIISRLRPGISDLEEYAKLYSELSASSELLLSKLHCVASGIHENSRRFIRGLACWFSLHFHCVFFGVHFFSQFLEEHVSFKLLLEGGGAGHVFAGMVNAAAEFANEFEKITETPSFLSSDLKIPLVDLIPQSIPIVVSGSFTNASVVGSNRALNGIPGFLYEISVKITFGELIPDLGATNRTRFMIHLYQIDFAMRNFIKVHSSIMDAATVPGTADHALASNKLCRKSLEASNAVIFVLQSVSNIVLPHSCSSPRHQIAADVCRIVMHAQDMYRLMTDARHLFILSVNANSIAGYFEWLAAHLKTSIAIELEKLEFSRAAEASIKAQWDMFTDAFRTTSSWGLMTDDIKERTHF